MEKPFRHLGTVSVLFVAVLLISNVASTKITDLGWFVFDAGTLLFPFAYILGDVMTEVYGYKRARSVIWLGFFSACLMAITFIVVGHLPPASDWPNQASYEAILGATPRIVLASLVAYFIGSFANSFVMAKMKILTKGKMLWARTIGSTVVGEFLDTTLFVMIAFFGVLPNALLVTIIVSNYVFKTLVEVVFTPVTYAVIGWLKKREENDHYDHDTDFNPFNVRAS